MVRPALILILLSFTPLAAAAQDERACIIQDEQDEHAHENETHRSADRALRRRLNAAMLDLEAQSKLRFFNALPWLPPQRGPEIGDAGTETMSGPDLYDRVAAATVMFHTAYKCDKCDDWHGGVTTGFIVHPDGWIVTAAHIVDDLDDDRTCAVMLRDERTLAVTGVWKVDSDLDVAVVKVDGENLPALALAATNPRAGETAYVLSHPQGAFFYLTCGIVSRVMGEDESPGDRLQITAEFATGSSGAPVVNDRGNLIGLVLATRTLYADRDDQRSPQMVMRNCAIVEDIRALLETEDR